ncbi:nuclear transport factor 2 family protein [Flavobacterium branchiicola]|uniref:Nuclear transport factor 2 family protein n=1 Tax=Flavobacterium branchiicola TaxID=1114875 RepID=A0ABV9PKF1_9FLAO|nr:nuclear transport factor 2 family protein [Flavobacterium branchiicola]MBS7256333.1 nuclear transport factor 2 family protein [Flavobacterium branchiicola]
MKTRKFLYLITASLFFFSSNAQEKDLVKKTIETYFDGWMTGDTLKLGKVMHSSCNLKIIKDNNVLVIDRKTYLSRFKLHPKTANTEGKIIDINITKNIASAKCEIQTPERLFVDYFNMMKLNDEWYIVDKISTSSEKK